MTAPTFNPNQLPLVLAGPILRRTEPDNVTVWVALQRSCVVTLRVFETTEQQVGGVKLKGDRATVALGQHLHVVAVTARSLAGDRLHPGTLYAYDLSFQELTRPTIKQTLPQAMDSPGRSLPQSSISYFSHQLPTFSLPPTNLAQLRIMHGSCRKLHGKGHDALPIVDALTGQTANLPNSRPHQLFLTGDQIYGDDVADPLLWALMAAEDELLQWDTLPIAPRFDAVPGFMSASDLPPGERGKFVEHQGGFTAGLHNKKNYAKSHLLSFGEYCLIYLFAWSPVLWTVPFPNGREVRSRRKDAKQWNAELKELQHCARTLWQVRRALANVPTYMIFDDHDISDDWNLNQAWCLRVLGKASGRQVVQNGLLAYTLFQGWGNTPDRFLDGQVGAQLLHQVEQWTATGRSDRAAWSRLTRLLGLPAADPLTGLPLLRSDEGDWVLDRDPDALTWSYTIRGTCHEVIVLDTRTWRGYPIADKPTAPPRLLSSSAFDRQLRSFLQPTSTPVLTLIVAPTNLFSLKLIDQIQHWNLRQHEVYNNDVGDAWNIHKAALAEFLATVFEHRQQVVVLSGDIHYGSAVQLSYWSHPGSTASKLPCALVQLTSSAIKNSEFKTRLVHTKLKSLLPEHDRYWIGWNDPPDLQEVASWRQEAQSDRPPPDWRYHIQWVQRQAAQTLIWDKFEAWDDRGWLGFVAWVKQLWRNRWLQEGKEVVGVNNIGVVSFEEFDRAAHCVIQDLYWYAPWIDDRVVFSRFRASLLAGETFAENCNKSDGF